MNIYPENCVHSRRQKLVTMYKNMFSNYYKYSGGLYPAVGKIRLWMLNYSGVLSRIFPNVSTGLRSVVVTGI